MWSTGEGNGKPLQYSCLENPMNSMRRQNDRILKEEVPRSVGAHMLLEISGEITPERTSNRISHSMSVLPSHCLFFFFFLKVASRETGLFIRMQILKAFWNLEKVCHLKSLLDMLHSTQKTHKHTKLLHVLSHKICSINNLLNLILSGRLLNLASRFQKIKTLLKCIKIPLISFFWETYWCSKFPVILFCLFQLHCNFIN